MDKTNSTTSARRHWNIGTILQESNGRQYVIVMKKQDCTCHLDEEFRIHATDGRSNWLPDWMKKRELTEEGLTEETVQ